MHNRIESFYGFPGGIEWINGRKTFTQRCTFQGTGEVMRIGYDAANFCKIGSATDGSMTFSNSLVPLTNGGANLGSTSITWLTVFTPTLQSNGNMTLQVGAGVGQSLTIQCGGQGVGKVYASTQNMLFTCTGTIPADQGIMFCIYEPTSPIIGGGTTTAGGTNVTLSSAGALDRYKIGDTITISGETQTITAIPSDTSLTTTTWTGAFTGSAMSTTGGPRFVVRGSGQIGVGVAAPSAMLNLPAGRIYATNAPLKIATGGALMTTPEANAIETDDTDLYYTASTTRYKLDKSLSGSATLDFGNTTTMTSTDLTITVTGAADGDAVVLGVPNASVNANSCYTAWVSATNTVTVRFNNYSSGSINPASGTFKVRVTK